MKSVFCMRCKGLLTENNSCPSSIKRGKGYCRPCTSGMSKARYAKNPEKYKKMSKNFRERNPESVKKTLKSYRGTVSGRYADLKGKAKKHNRLLDISFDEYAFIIASSFCKYCGGSLSSCGYALDRIDSSKDYVKDNCVPCCGGCNRRKGRLEQLGFSFTRSIELLHEINEIRNQEKNFEYHTNQRQFSLE